jgi:hypothetical protein
LAEEPIATGFIHEATLGGTGADILRLDVLHAANSGGFHGVHRTDLRSTDALDCARGSGLDIINGVHLRGVALGGADTLGADIIDLPSLGGFHIGNWAHLRGQDALRLDLIGSIACWTLDILHSAHASSSGLGGLGIGYGSDLSGLRVAYVGNAGTLRLVGGDILGGNLVGPVELAEGQLV